MNNKFRANPIFKLPKADPIEKTLYRLQKNRVDNSRSKFFRFYISNNDIAVFIGTVLAWNNDPLKPQLKNFITIQTDDKMGFIVLIHTSEPHKKNAFTNAFGMDNIEIPADLKGEKNLDNLEAQIDRNKTIYYRSNNEFEINVVMMKMCELFEIQYHTSTDDDKIIQEKPTITF